VIDQGTWQWQGYSTECGAAAEHITEQDSTPEIDPAHGATFTSEGDNRGCNMLVKPKSFPGDLDRERSLRCHYWHLAESGPGPRFGLEQVKIEPVHIKGQHSDGEVLTARKEANFVVMEGAGLGEQPKRRAFSPVDEVVAHLPRPDGWATDADAEEEEAVRRGNDTGILQKEVRAQIG